MQLLMFVVHDSCSGVYDRPFCARSENEAVRSFGDIASDASHPIGAHPEHFKLFGIGSYEDSTGEIVPVPPRFVANAIDLVNAVRDINPGGLNAFDDKVRDLVREDLRDEFDNLVSRSNGNAT